MSRLLKQLLIAGLFGGLLLALAFPVYRLFVAAPTCTDGVQNQGEEGLDCGVVCGRSCPPAIVALEAMTPTILRAGDGYEVVAELRNPNGAFGAKRVPYTLTLTDASGEEVATRQGTTYVNPAQPRYLVFSFPSLTDTPTKAELQFDAAAVQWGALEISAAGAVAFAVRGEQLTTESDAVHYNATVTNRSAFDFDVVDIAVLLYDSSNRLVGAGTTVARTLVANQTRGFVVDWPFAIPDAVRAETVITTNIFDNQNFIRVHGIPERFQEN